MNTFPDAFLRRMERQLGPEMPFFLHALEAPAVRGIRMNPFKPFEGREDFETGIPVPWCGDGYTLPFESCAGATVFHEAGAFYLQEPAAMLPAEVLNAKPGETVLDLCAAPGGKSTQIGLAMRGDGILVCNEPVPSRAQILSRNIERIGIPNAVVVSAMPEKLAERWNGCFDAVLVDAPCSGEGMFRRDPDTRSEWNAEQAEGCAKRQKEILREAAKMVRPGGRIVYSTCTYNPAENEDNIAWFLENHRDFELCPWNLPGTDKTEGMYTCFPHRNMGEGQFVANLRRTGQTDPPSLTRVLPLPDRTVMQAYRASFPIFPEPDGMIGNRLVRLASCPDMKGVQILRAGLHLAEIKGKTLVPDHAAAMSIIPVRAADAELNDRETLRYLAGEEVAGNAEGWARIRYKGLVLGWGKGSGGTIKNHYPKGLRKHNLLAGTDTMP
ncbi:MAG: RsmF rRNA methyltransferase first C-terminal domain-containing protein [Clostridia bacterium]|nr:RsmF rRNA methyltransferase first C-terminal domain-containing protein [Clostridia bacterium]